MTQGDMVRRAPFALPGDRFPGELGAVVQRTVLDGREPARLVVHAMEGDWAAADGVNDPNEPGACIATHIRHAVGLDASLEDVTSMPPGHLAWRADPWEPWEITPHEWEDGEPGGE